MNPPGLALPAWATEMGEDRYGIFASFEIQGIAFRFRWIPKGGFLMGSPDDEEGRFRDEGPQHPVELTAGFWLGETPVTRAQWEAVEGTPDLEHPKAHHPKVNVDWDQSAAFAKQIAERKPGFTARLPTEAEWEYACRAGTKMAFNNGMDCTVPGGQDPALDQVGWYRENARRTTKAVCQLAPNKWGLYDMHGNVDEWCLDYLRTYTDSGEIDPVGSLDAAGRAIRGGSWNARARCCRSAYRIGGDRGFAGDFLGLRLAAGPEPTESAQEKEQEKQEQEHQE